MTEPLQNILPNPSGVLRDLPVSQANPSRVAHRLEVPYEVVLPFFRRYQADWNALVASDRSGARLSKTVSRAHKDYLRRKVSNPLRLKPWKRVTSIPVTSDLKSALKGVIQVDWRRVTKPRIVRRGQTASLVFVTRQEVPGAVPDPRKVDVGLTITPTGVVLAIQSPMDTLEFRSISRKNLTRERVRELVEVLGSKARVVALDPISPGCMQEVRNWLVKGLRSKQAEGAIVFRSPKWVSLGEKYFDVPEGSPMRWKHTLRKDLKKYQNCFVFMGLTGKPLMVSIQNGALVNADGSQVSPLDRATNAIHTVLAKLDLWQAVTFLHSRDRQRVQNAFHRWSRKTIMIILKNKSKRLRLKDR